MRWKKREAHTMTHVEVTGLSDRHLVAHGVFCTCAENSPDLEAGAALPTEQRGRLPRGPGDQEAVRVRDPRAVTTDQASA